MAWSFGNSFDLYAAVPDTVAGYWDSGSAGNFSLVAGRFAGSQALQNISATGFLAKSSGVNDAAHHLVVAFRQTQAISGATLGAYLELFDGATAQCSVVFRSDGAILLTSGGPAGTVLATYTGAFPVASTWYAFEIEVVINNTAGSFAVRKNGNPVNDFTLGSLNTRVSANNYANKLQFGMNATVSSQQIDDLFWRSDASSVAWLGDIRCYARAPASDASVTFSRAPATFTLPPFSTSSAAGQQSVAGQPRYSGFISQGSSLNSVSVTFATGFTGNVKCAIFACTSTLGATNSIGAILGTATAPIANPVAGTPIVFSFSPAVSLPFGTLFYVGVCSDTNSGTNSILGANVGPYSQYAVISNTAYASFPAASPATLTAPASNHNYAPGFATANSLYVSEAQQDALTSYVYDSTPGDADFYGVASIASTPATVIATTTRAYMQKSDAGTRTAAVQLKSGATTVASPTLVLTTSGWLWAWRTDIVDPNTGAAWTPAAVNNCTIGPKTVA